MALSLCYLHTYGNDLGDAERDVRATGDLD